MKIAILGVGNVGAALARGWARQGHRIILGARDVAKPEVQALARELGKNCAVATPAEAAQEAEVAVLATPWKAAEELLRQLRGPLTGKVLVDCTNPLKPDLSGLVTGPDRSGAEILAEIVPGADLVKCFNTTGADNMANPQYAEGRAVMLLAGGSPAAKARMRQLSDELGFTTIDAGGLQVARLLESFAMLWIHLAFRGGLGRDFAFQLMRRAPSP